MATTLVEQIEAMRIQMHEQARSEQDLVHALGLALRRADEKLLEAVRTVSLEHELRREDITRELHALATRMGALPIPQVEATTRHDASLNPPNHGSQRRRVLAPTTFRG
jgi:hypothetical protein